MYVPNNLFFKEGCKMKTKMIAVLVVFALFCFFSAGLHAQTATDAQRIVGTWVAVGEDSYTIVLNSNGTVSFNGESTRYALFPGLIAINFDGETVVFEYYFSNDNNSLLLVFKGSSEALWFTRRR